jgi:hypothetical protein
LEISIKGISREERFMLRTKLTRFARRHLYWAKASVLILFAGLATPLAGLQAAAMALPKLPPDLEAVRGHLKKIKIPSRRSETAIGRPWDAWSVRTETWAFTSSTAP